MARDNKLALSFTYENAATVGTGGMRINNFAAAGTSNYAYVYMNAAGSAYFFNRAASNSINVGGFRNTLADASVLVTQAGGSAIANDPAIIGVTSPAEFYCRLTVGAAGPAAAANTRTFVCVEAASDSGTGTAGSDWSPISPLLDVSAQSGPRSVPTGTFAAGVFTSGSAHNLAVGDVVIFTASTTSSGTDQPANQRPYYVATVPSSTTFTVALTPGGAVITSFNNGTGFTATAVVRRLFGLQCAPTTKPWVRLAVQVISTSGTAAASQGAWIQDAFMSVGRDNAAVV
jgi:hypothetical protein